MKEMWPIIAGLLFIMLVALAFEVSVYYYPLIRIDKKKLHFVEPVDWSLIRLRLSRPLSNYDANYYYEYIRHSQCLSACCASLSSEIAKKCNTRFTYISAIYSFCCKHPHSFSYFQFTGPPTEHFLIIIPMHSGKNQITWNQTNSIFRDTICIVPSGKSTAIQVAGYWVLLAIASFTNTADII